MGKNMVEAAEARFERLFARCREDVNDALRGLLAAQAATGSLRSGATIIKSARLFEEHSLRALNACTSDIGKHVEDRGKNWHKMLASLRTVLEAHIGQRSAVLSQAAKASGTSIDSFVPLLDKTAIRLRQNLADFEEGWTAPKGKAWRERRPVAYALLLAAGGAASRDLLGWSTSYVRPFAAFLRSLL